MGYSYACIEEYLNGRPLGIDKPFFYLITSHPKNWIIYWLVGDIELKMLGLNQSICRGYEDEEAHICQKGEHTE